MSPRTKLNEENILDSAQITETEFNEFFGSVVITGTEDQTSVIQSFPDYFIASDIITSASGITVATGTGQVVLGVGGLDNFSYETIISGIEITIPLYQQMIVHEPFDIQDGGILNIEGTLVLEP